MTARIKFGKTRSMMECVQCGAKCIRMNGFQRYCTGCADKRSSDRKAAYKKENPSRSTTEQNKKAWNRVKSQAVQRGEEFSERERLGLSSVFRDESGMCWVRRLAVDFTYNLSKNKMWGYSNGSHVFNRQESRASRDLLAAQVKGALDDVTIVDGKLWIDIIVQKSNHRGDAVNLVDVVCDAIKVATGLDDRWYALKGVDWQIIKTRPQVLIGIGQEYSEPRRICSYCGRILTLDRFQNDREDKHGKGRECKDCVNGGPRPNAGRLLTADHVREIRKSGLAGEKSHVIGARYGVDSSVIRRILRGDSYKNV